MKNRNKDQVLEGLVTLESDDNWGWVWVHTNDGKKGQKCPGSDPGGRHSVVGLERRGVEKRCCLRTKL